MDLIQLDAQLLSETLSLQIDTNTIRPARSSLLHAPVDSDVLADEASFF